MNTRRGRYFGRTSLADWRAAVKLIEAQRAEIRENSNIMSEYERLSHRREIEDTVAEWGSVIFAGISREYTTALEAFAKTKQDIDKAKMREIARWESGRLREEMDLLNMRVNMALKPRDAVFGGAKPAQEISALYQEALESGDPVKKRAAAEIMKGLTDRVSNLDQDTRLLVNRVSKQAEADLTQLRTTEDLQRSIQAHQEAWSQVAQIWDEMRTVGQVIEGEDPAGIMAGGAYAKALRRVQIDRMTGTIQVYPEDSVEVTGVLERGENQVYQD